MCLFQGKKNWATQASKHKIDHNSMTLNSNLYYFVNTYCWCLLPSPWTSGSEYNCPAMKTIDTIDSQYIIYIIHTFIPRRRYIYICPRVHLILLIFISTMGYETWLSKTLAMTGLFWPLKIFISVTIFDVTIFDVTIFDVTIFDVTIFEITKEIPLQF